MVITRKKKEPFDVITDPPDTFPEETMKRIEKVVENFAIQVANSPIQGDGSIVFDMGDQLLDIAAAEPTLDRYLDRSPKLNTDQDYEELVSILQKKRAMFITAEQKKREPKVDGEEAPQAESED